MSDAQRQLEPKDHRHLDNGEMARPESRRMDPGPLPSRDRPI